MQNAYVLNQYDRLACFIILQLQPLIWRWTAASSLSLGMNSPLNTTAWRHLALTLHNTYVALASYNICYNLWRAVQLKVGVCQKEMQHSRTANPANLFGELLACFLAPF